MTDDAFGSAIDQPITQPDAPAAPDLPAPIEVASAAEPPAQQPASFLQGQNMPGAAPASGISPSYHATVGQIESSGGRDYGNGGGIYQFMPGTAKSLGYTQDQIRAMTPEQQTALNDRFTKQNTAPLANAGLPVNDVTAYVAHQQGGGGAVKLLKADPNTSAVDVVGKAAADGNKPFFYNADGTPKTVAQTLGAFQQRVASAGGKGSVPTMTAAAQPNPPKQEQQPQTTGERMKAWLRAQSAQNNQPPTQQQQPQAQKPADDEPLMAQFQVAPPAAPVSGIVRSGGKVYFQRYGRIYDTSGNAVG